MLASNTELTDGFSLPQYIWLLGDFNVGNSSGYCIRKFMIKFATFYRTK